jgi:hypothetical protein
MTITEHSSLEDVAFIVCTTLTGCGITAVLTGGSAATFYAPEAYQSRDVDFIIQFAHSDKRQLGAAALSKLGYTIEGETYVHGRNQFTLDFPPGPLAIGDDLVSGWSRVQRDHLTLNILSATDCVRDRLLWFYLQGTDRSSLRAAVGVAQRHPIDLEFIRTWSTREGFAEKFAEFERQVSSNGVT